MDPLDTLRQLAISLLMGLLVGLQRERTGHHMAGVRSFPLITLFGTLSALLARELQSPWILATGVLAIVAVMIVGNLPKFGDDAEEHGVTSELAMLVMYAVGAFVTFGPWVVAATVTGCVAVLLHLKPQLHGFAQRLGDADFKAILQFVVITFVVLPILPNVDYDPMTWIAEPLQSLFPSFEPIPLPVLNPREIWLMVVLVVGISLGGYVAYKRFGHRAGIVLGGLIGGLVSSTATTAGQARRTKQSPGLAGAAAIVIVLASTVVYLRVLVEIAVAGPKLMPAAIIPIAVMLVVSIATVIPAWMLWRSEPGERIEQGNPSDLRSALWIAAFYALIVLAVAAGKTYLQDTGLYSIAALSGMTDMDAITLSSSRLVQSGTLDPAIGWRLVVIGVMSNLVFKAGLAAMLGGRALLIRLAPLFAAPLIAGGVLLAVLR